MPTDYNKALEMIDSRLVYWPKFLVHKCKQRLTRLTQVAIRSKRLQKEQERLGERFVPRMAPKVRQREDTRERKAEAAARVERAIERELIERLRSGAYGDRPLNVEESMWQRVLHRLERRGEARHDEETDEHLGEGHQKSEAQYEFEPSTGELEYISGDDLSIASDADELDDFEDWLGGEHAAEEDSESDSNSVESLVSATVGPDEDDSESDAGKSLKKRLNALKRKRPAAKESKGRKKIQKPPKRHIEYEMERAETDVPTVITV